ncbi:MAG: twin-arginine translocase subunit TatC, partial [Lentisphaeraceae bacterium]|nr:twin-arginine translocase subunit TatC [Lentisphaeraceae bacterium]
AYILFLIGSMFGLLVIVPISLDFFSSLETSYLRYTPRLTDMVSFILRIAVATGIASQLPVVVVLLFAMGLVTIEKLSKIRSYVVVAIFIGAAILTPPDVTSQLMVGLPTYLIYELSIIVCRILNLGKDPKNASKSKMIQIVAFFTLFVIVFGGAYGIWYTKNWYESKKNETLVDNPSQLEEYRDLLAEEDGMELLSSALTEERKAIEKASVCTVLLEAWDKEEMKDRHRQKILQYVFNAKLDITRLEDENSIEMDFIVTRSHNIPVNVDFYWQLKIDKRTYMWPDSDNNLHYTYNPSKKSETIIRKNVLPNIPAAAKALAKDGNHQLSLILKVVRAENPDGTVAAWADSVSSKEVGHATGNVKKKDDDKIAEK